jgi:hypothetical protein
VLCEVGPGVALESGMPAIPARADAHVFGRSEPKARENLETLEGDASRVRVPL